MKSKINEVELFESDDTELVEFPKGYIDIDKDKCFAMRVVDKERRLWNQFIDGDLLFFERTKVLHDGKIMLVENSRAEKVFRRVIKQGDEYLLTTDKDIKPYKWSGKNIKFLAVFKLLIRK